MKSRPTHFPLDTLGSFADVTAQLTELGLWVPTLTLEQLDSVLTQSKEE